MMSEENKVKIPFILPQLDMEALQAKAIEAAQAGAESKIRSFYTDYNSPYRKEIENQLSVPSISFDLPDILAVLNDKISSMIDEIANRAVAETYLPMVTEFLTKAPATMKFSEFLTHVVECTEYEWDTYLSVDDFVVEFSREEGSFINVDISWKLGKIYSIGFFKETEDNWRIYSIPSLNNPDYARKMVLIQNDVTLKLPFVPNILDDKLTKLCARMKIAQTSVTFDVRDFTEGNFPERTNCHC